MKWDALFPDHSDYTILLPLPLRYRTVFLAKITALAAFMGMFLLAVNAVSLLLFPAISFRSAIAGLFRTYAANSLTLLGAGLFAFFLVAALHGVLMNLLPYGSVQRIAPYLQSALLVMLLALFFFSLQTSQSLLHYKEANNLVLYFAPPYWFAGLYDRLLGIADPVQMELSKIALRWFGTVFVIAVVSYFINYRRHLRQVMEWQPDTGGSLTWAARALAGLADRVLVRTPRQQAVYWFALRTLLRSRRHRLLLGIYTAAGVALVAEGGVAMLAGVGHFRQDVSTTLLCWPILVTFFVLAGMRHGFSLPFELQSSWVFRLTNNVDSDAVATAVRRAALTLTVVPLCASSAVAFFVVFPWRYAVFCGATSVVVSLLVVELFLLNWQGMPFANPRRDQHPAIVVLGLTTCMVATAFAYGIANLEIAAKGRILFELTTFLVLTFILILAILCRLRTRVFEEAHSEYEGGAEQSPYLLLDLSS